MRHGIRDEDDADADARRSEMPAFGEWMDEEEIAAIAAHAQSISGGAPARPELLEAGAALRLDDRSSCHGERGLGDRGQGAPNPTDAICLHGGDAEGPARSISQGPFGVMPPSGGRLGGAQVRSVAARRPGPRTDAAPSPMPAPALVPPGSRNRTAPLSAGARDHADARRVRPAAAAATPTRRSIHVEAAPDPPVRGAPMTDAPSLRAPRVPIFPRGVSSPFGRREWGIRIATLGVHCVTPWSRRDRGPTCPTRRSS